MNETLRRSSLAEVRSGTKVNLGWRWPSTRARGHLSRATPTASARCRPGPRRWLRAVVTVRPTRTLRYVVGKGSITVDGVSLTVASIDEASFDVSLIPETLERTNLGTAAPGTPVNLEVDILAKYVEKLLS
jgi:riboflavin synthase